MPPTTNRLTVPHQLTAYFTGGWAFLVPYLALYLLYAWFSWPVQGGAPTGIPPLLHVYWCVHALHLALGAVALRSWWRGPGTGAAGGGLKDAIQRLAPWLCLGLLFGIPGVYLEFPADPWHHYARVNEWSWLQAVTEHSEWKKSSYLLAYSLIGGVAPATRQLAWLDVYYAGCCLLLSWQYYRLARAIGLGAPAAFSFVLILALAFGNNVFGFYRYYGMSSSLFAQLAAVAATRAVLEMVTAEAPFSFRCVPARAGSLLALGLLATFNHIQGVGIAALGCAAVLGWRLTVWRRTMIWWLAGAALVLSAAAVLWFPRHPLLDQAYRPEGWLTPWYGFNLFEPGSPAAQRAIAILGAFGMANLVAALLLARRNHLVAWLTLLPIIALCLPVVAIPFASALAPKAGFLASGYILAFSRMLLAVPTGLAFSTLAEHWLRPSRGKRTSTTECNTNLDPAWINRAAFPLLLGALLAFLTVPAAAKYHNRLFNVLLIPPADLAMAHIVRSAEATAPRNLPKISESSETRALHRLEYGSILATPGIGYVLNATGNAAIHGARKWMTWPSTTPPSLNSSLARGQLASAEMPLIRRANFPPLGVLFTPGSQTGFLSGHWLVQEVALEHATQGELFAPVASANRAPQPPEIWLEWWPSGQDSGRFIGRAATNGVTLPVEDRGLLQANGAPFVIRPPLALTLRPVMKTTDGNIWRIVLRIRHAGGSSERQFFGAPSRLHRDAWLYGDYELLVREPGRYELEIVGTTLTPKHEYVVRYHFIVPP